MKKRDEVRVSNKMYFSFCTFVTGIAYIKGELFSNGTAINIRIVLYR